jgi:hypothetical protein
MDAEAPPGETYQDPVDLILKERSRRRRSLLAAAAAFAILIAWIWLVDAWTTKARALGPNAVAYYTAYSAAPMALAALSAAASLALRGRSWFRFFVVFAIAGAFVLTSQLKGFLEFPGRVLDQEQRAQRAYRSQSLLAEEKELVAELAQQRPFAAAGLASEEAIALSETRLAELLDILSASAELDTPQDPVLAGLTYQLRNAQADDFRSARAALAFLRTSWGHWSFRDQRVSFDDPRDQQRFDQMQAHLQEVERRTEELGARLESNLPPQPPR